MILLYILLAVICVSAVSLIGLFLLGFKTKTLDKITHYLVSFAAGSMIGAAFLHIMPEASEQLSNLLPYLIVILGIILFFVIEKVLHWRHCHEGHCKVHSVAYLNLFGDAIHNFMDGIAIATSFLISPELGLTTTIAILIHEIPQELGDYGILIHSGLSKAKALCYNFLSAIFAILGALLTYLFANYITGLTIYLMPLIAGGFIYMAAVDLIPEMHKQTKIKTSILQFLLMILGIALMWIMKLVLDVA
jgi:zinc and cadmium transporter